MSSDASPLAGSAARTSGPSTRAPGCCNDGETPDEDTGQQAATVTDESGGGIEGSGASGVTAVKAEANKSIAQAQAEIRRAAAVAVEQEMKAKVEEMQAKVVEAEAQVPLALAEAFRSGNLGVMDYYRLNNIKADTDMRDSISKGGENN